MMTTMITMKKTSGYTIRNMVEGVVQFEVVNPYGVVIASEIETYTRAYQVLMDDLYYGSECDAIE